MSDVAAEIVKIVSPPTGTVPFLQTLGKLYDSFGIGAQAVDAVSLSLQNAVNNVSLVNEYIKDVRANCFCASLLARKSTCDAMPRQATPCIERAR